jgi:hypothetical protein
MPGQAEGRQFRGCVCRELVGCSCGRVGPYRFACSRHQVPRTCSAYGKPFRGRSAAQESGTPVRFRKSRSMRRSCDRRCAAQDRTQPKRVVARASSRHRLRRHPLALLQLAPLPPEPDRSSRQEPPQFDSTANAGKRRGHHRRDHCRRGQHNVIDAVTQNATGFTASPAPNGSLAFNTRVHRQFDGQTLYDGVRLCVGAAR